MSPAILLCSGRTPGGLLVIAVIDYGMGNIRSVLNAFAAVGAEALPVREPRALRDARGIVLPGVGAFGDAIGRLHAYGLVEPLERDVRDSGKSFLGICLGMQLLATTGTEHGEYSGLGWIPGRVDRLPAAPGLRLPHIGWNTVRFTKTRGAFAGLGEAQTFYFVHGFAVTPRDASVVSGLCDHGGDFVAAIEADNIWATQFHPEKSQSAGLALLRNWVEQLRAC